MRKNIPFLTILCLIAIAGLLSLQCNWIIKYYYITKQNFEKEVNTAFENALRKEFEIRGDSVEKLLVRQLSDTNFVTISSGYNKKYNIVDYTISSTINKKDAFSSTFSTSGANRQLKSDDDSLKLFIIKRFAKMLRKDDFENHITYYRTQELGTYMDDLTGVYTFDTTRLRPILNKYLAEKNILIGYRFQSSPTDSISALNPVLSEKYPVITRSIPTYSKIGHVRVLFQDPFTYILANMWVIFLSSLVLVVLIGCSLYALMRSLAHEKMLSAIKNDFISNITHEFKTPLATIGVAIEALKDPVVFQDTQKTARYLNHASNEVKRVTSLTEKILKMSLYEGEHIPIRPERIMVDQTIQNIIEVQKLSDSQLDISFSNSSGVTQIYADLDQFSHAVSNVIDNAVKYAGTNPVIQVSCKVESNFMVITVQDNGSGIPSVHIPFVFEKFYRVSTTKIKGHGLGLSYVKQIIAKHSGWYTLTSDHSGTEVKLAWPL